MKWQGRRQSDNIIDAREGSGPRRRMGAAPKMGLGSIVILGLAVFALGGDPRIILSLLQNQMQQGAGMPPQSSMGPQSSHDSDDSKGLVSVTLADLEDKWGKMFQQRGARYQPAPLVLFRGGTDTGCGYGQTASGPFYCPADGRVYLDLSFMDDLNRLGGEGDFALAYVVAHEVGHHVQNLLNPNKMRSKKSQSESIGIELQADCFAGVWAHHANNERDFLEPGDIEEAITTAAAVGDDHIQRSAGRSVSPESFTHGTSEQRQKAFAVGFQSGRMESCSFSS
jgi:predicted metalloprotease